MKNIVKTLILLLATLLTASVSRAGCNPPYQNSCIETRTNWCEYNATLTASLLPSDDCLCIVNTQALTFCISATASATPGSKKYRLVLDGPDCCDPTNIVWSETAPITITSTWSIVSATDSTNGSGLTTCITTTNPGNYTVRFHIWTIGDCPAPPIDLVTNVVVRRLTVKTDPWLGIDLTDAHVTDTNEATASIEGPNCPCDNSVTNFDWTITGPSANPLFDPPSPGATTTTGNPVTYKETHTPSDSYLHEELTVAINPSGCIAKTNFTVVKVDVVWGGMPTNLLETQEETLGGFVVYEKDRTNALGTVIFPDNAPIAEGTNMVPLEVKVTPTDLPANEIINLSFDGDTFAKNVYVIESGVFKPAQMSYTIGTLPLRFYIHGHTPSTALRDRKFTAWHPSSMARDCINLTILKVDIVPDFNHDRVINDTDQLLLEKHGVFHFWINDDADQGDISSGSKIVPGQTPGWLGGLFSAPNYYDNIINGRCDLTDFCPLWIDLNQPLNLFLSSGATVQYKLKQTANAIKIVYTDLAKNNAGDFLTVDGTTYGPSFSQSNQCANVTEFTSGTIDLSTGFLNKILSDATKGILLMEGAATSTEPLILEIWLNGEKVCEKKMPLNISGVEDMFRWINLRKTTGGSVTYPTRTNSPPNYPDSLCNGKQVVLIHGYSCDEDAARANGSKFFKRLYQSGSMAMFTMLVWRSDVIRSYTGALNYLPAEEAFYHADVENALLVASNVPPALASLPGELYLAAHSLGNMVASSAISEFGLNPNIYFMIDAAVAMETYDGLPCSNPLELVPAVWTNYETRLWSSEWHDRFTFPDTRSTLTWNMRFGDIPQAINYYSEGEEVLANNISGTNFSKLWPSVSWTPSDTISISWDDDSWWPSIHVNGSALIPSVSWKPQDMAWVFQERIKGGTITTLLPGVDSHGGWGFNSVYTGLFGSPMDPATANLLSNDVIRVTPFYKPFNITGIYGTNGSVIASNPTVRCKLFAEAIPAVSRATGANKILGFGMPLGIDSGNIDMNAVLRRPSSGGIQWPPERATSSYGNHWLHCDFREVAFPFVYKLFDDMVTQGGLQ